MIFKPSDLCNEFPNKANVCEPFFTTYGSAVTFSSPISIVKVYKDDVLVLDGGGSKRCSLLGDKLASVAASRDLARIIVNGCVRDSTELAEIEVGILTGNTRLEKH